MSFRLIISCLSLFFCSLVLCSVTSFAAPPQVTHLQCEYMPNPLGIDVTNPRLSWYMQDGTSQATQTAYRLWVGTDSVAVSEGRGASWDTDKTASDHVCIRYGGKPLEPFTRYYWRVAVWNHEGKQITSTVHWFETAFMDKGTWVGNWISDGHDQNFKPAPYFRHVIDVSKKIRSARAYIAVAGLYELSINGMNIGDHRLDPMYTRFDRRTLYVTYDVTNQLHTGQNALGVILGNGWYNHQSTAVWNFHQAPWRNRPAFCMDVRVTYEDGTVETFGTDNAWTSSTGAIIFNSIYTGEHQDARLEKEGWNTVDFKEDEKEWPHVGYRSAPAPKIVSEVLRPIRNVAEIPAQSVRKFNDTTYVFDLGRNISGVSRITVKGAAGTVLHVKHGERLYEDGHVDISNLDVHYRPTDNTDPFETDIYILSGKGEETFMPHFNYKGFQYIEVTSSKPISLKKENLTGFFMHSDVPVVGTIKSSNDFVNKLWWATNNSYLSNLMGYPTDCPQREKNGWTGDAHLAVETGLYGFDAITVYEKWLADHRDEQQPNGVLPSIIPTGGWGYGWGNGPDWTSTIAIIPWQVYLFYGDPTLLAKSYDPIKRYVEHIRRISPTGITSWGLGDWAPADKKPPVAFTSTVYYYLDAHILAEAARLFNKEEDYKTYSALAEQIKTAFNKEYLSTTGVYGTGMQAEQCMPLAAGMVPDDARAMVTKNLVDRVKEKNYHMDVGILGAKAILNALSENGYPEVAYQLLVQKTYPSWGAWLAVGATTLYEYWDMKEYGISLNHIMFGEAAAWLYKGLAGLYTDPAQPGFKHIKLSPYMPKDLDTFEASHQSPYGKIVSGWTKKKSTVHYYVEIPAGATATFTVPAGYVIKHSSLPKTEWKKSPAILSLTSGRHTFELKPRS